MEDVSDIDQSEVDEFEVGARGQMVIAKALAYAIATISTLPRNRQEFSDMCDMAYLLDNSSWANSVREVVRFHTGMIVPTEDELLARDAEDILH